MRRCRSRHTACLPTSPGRHTPDALRVASLELLPRVSRPGWRRLREFSSSTMKASRLSLYRRHGGRRGPVGTRVPDRHAGAAGDTECQSALHRKTLNENGRRDASVVRELIARVEELLRRTRGLPAGATTGWPGRSGSAASCWSRRLRQSCAAGQPVRVTHTEFRLLLALMRRRGRHRLANGTAGGGLGSRGRGQPACGGHPHRPAAPKAGGGSGQSAPHPDRARLGISLPSVRTALRGR